MSASLWYHGNWYWCSKSSFINLLLGCQLFPTDPLKCTNTVCEIRVSDNGVKEAIAFYKPESTDDGQSIALSSDNTKNKSSALSSNSTKNKSSALSSDNTKNKSSALSSANTKNKSSALSSDNTKNKSSALSSDNTKNESSALSNSLKGIQEFKDHVTEANDDDENPYERSVLTESMTRPELDAGSSDDTPGIEGGQNVDQSLTRYLSKAFGFIFIINTTTAGGVQPSRTVVNNAKDFDPKASLFIGNKWEFVPNADKEDVKADIFAKLQKLYPGIQPSQIHYMSVTKLDGSTQIRDLVLTGSSVVLPSGSTQIPDLVLTGSSVVLPRWLSSFLQRCEYLLRVFCNNSAQDHGQLEQQRSSLKERVQLLRKNSDECTKKLREKVEYDIYKITEKVKAYMKSKAFLD
ncbi:hypothetical protein DPMN_087959, partial [Dreissena polymorpha]